MGRLESMTGCNSASSPCAKGVSICKHRDGSMPDRGVGAGGVVEEGAAGRQIKRWEDGSGGRGREEH